MVAKIMNGIFVTNEKHAANHLIQAFNDKFQFGTIICGPEKLHYFE